MAQSRVQVFSAVKLRLSDFALEFLAHHSGSLLQRQLIVGEILAGLQFDLSLLCLGSCGEV